MRGSKSVKAAFFVWTWRKERRGVTREKIEDKGREFGEEEGEGFRKGGRTGGRRIRNLRVRW